MPRVGIPLKEITTGELYQEIEKLKKLFKYHIHEKGDTQQIDGLNVQNAEKVYATTGWFGSATDGVSIDAQGLILTGEGYIKTAVSGGRVELFSNEVRVYDANYQRYLLSNSGFFISDTNGNEGGSINSGPSSVYKECWVNGVDVLQFRLVNAAGTIDIKFGAVATADVVSISATNFNILMSLQCDSFRIDQTPTAETITPDKTITISCDGVNYKIPVVAA